MALSLKQAFQEIRHELGGRTDSRISELAVVNRAGEYLCARREWKFLERGPVDLDVVANQGYMSLPDDLSSVMSLTVKGSTFVDFQPTTLGDVLERRALGTTDPHCPIFWALSYNDSANDGGDPVPIALIYPSPVSDQIGYASLVYRAGWKRLSTVSDSTMLCGKNGRLPDWCEALFVEYIRAFAAGYERSTAGSVSDRLAAVDSGPLYAAAVRRDIKAQRTKGIMAAMPSAERSWSDGDALPPG